MVHDNEPQEEAKEKVKKRNLIPDDNLFSNNKNTNIKSEGSSGDSKNDDETTTIKKPKLTNKERARKARQRKKKYYEDLEKRAAQLEQKVVDLNKELDYCKQKLKFYEGRKNPTTVEETKPLENVLMDEWLNLVKTLPDDCSYFEKFNKVAES